MLVDHVLEVAEQDPKTISVYLHLSPSNDGAKNLYQKKGFSFKELVPDYFQTEGVAPEAELWVKEIHSA
jgi:ribosomal protein S18 acetylase RimI-like enzyme